MWLLTVLTLLIFLTFPELPGRPRIHLNVVLVSDTDQEVAPGQPACSEFLEGIVSWEPVGGVFSVNFRPSPTRLCSRILFANRGMELSDVILFEGKLLALDDKTGIIYQIFRENSSVSAWTRLLDGDGETSEPFKGEWSTVKDGRLYVGGYGKFYTDSTGRVTSCFPMWIKVIDREGRVLHVNWTENYLALSGRLGVHHPGFVIHEAAVWSRVHSRWVFLPRAVSRESYCSGGEGTAGSDVMLIADESFLEIDVVRVGRARRSRGFSAVRFVPGSGDILLMALKTEEGPGRLYSYFLIFDIDGRVLHEETRFAPSKYEGIEFI